METFELSIDDKMFSDGKFRVDGDELRTDAKIGASSTWVGDDRSAVDDNLSRIGKDIATFENNSVGSTVSQRGI